MSRLLLLPPFIVWVAWLATRTVAPVHSSLLFLAVYAAVLGGMGTWNILIARGTHRGNLLRHSDRFSQGVFIARIFIPLWFAAGLYWLGWGDAVLKIVGPMVHWPVKLPVTLIATLPAVATWSGLILAQYPAERALREQSLRDRLAADLPVTMPTSALSYFATQWRMNLLFTLLPVLAILFVKDVLMLGAHLCRLDTTPGNIAEIVASIVGIAIVFPMAPELLRRVLRTRRMMESELRTKLEKLFARAHVGCRDILVWETDSSVGNALVMGVVPSMRYILLSDLMLQTMSDEQIEAVFAHEVGHIMHRHLAWNLVLALVATGVASFLDDCIKAMHPPSWLSADLISCVTSLGTFVWLFGFISRRFERQADVYAARVIEGEHVRARELVLVGEQQSTLRQSSGQAVIAQQSLVSAVNWHVGIHGARVFASTLRRIADVNAMPTRAKPWTGGGIVKMIGHGLHLLRHGADNFFHGSIESRAKYLHHLSADPARTRAFDKFMARLYVAMLVSMVLFGAWTVLDVMKDGAGAPATVTSIP
jgi:STE24 endopeptidase